MHLFLHIFAELFFLFCSKVDGSKTYVLKFDMHCQCNGCIKKINDGVKEISLSEGTQIVHSFFMVTYLAAKKNVFPFDSLICSSG